MSSDSTLFKTKSEEWTHLLLRRLGYADEDIEYPDRNNNSTKDVDFLVPNLAIEVKELTPNDFDLQEERRVDHELRSKKMTGTFLPDRTRGLQRHVKDANYKFGKYKELPTLLILDIEWGQREPSLEFLLLGIQQISLPSGKVFWKSRAIRPDTASNISCILIKTRNRIHLYYMDRIITVSDEFIKRLKLLVPATHLWEYRLRFGNGRNIIEQAHTGAAK